MGGVSRRRGGFLSFAPRCLLLLCFFVVVVSGQQQRDEEQQQQREMEEDEEVVLGVNNDAIRKALRETFPSADDLERATFLAGEIQEELNVTDADAFDVQTFADVEADGLRVVTESFVATTLPTSENNYSMKFVAVSEQLTPNASYGAVVCGFAHPEKCMGSPMMGGAYDYDDYACGRADIDVAETSHFCELIAEGDTNEDGEIVFIGTPNLVSLQEIRGNETSLEGDDDSEGSKEPPLLLHTALVRLPPTPEEDQKQTPARKLLQGLGGGIGFGGGIGGMNRFGVGGLGVSSLGGINNIVAQDPLFQSGTAHHVAFAQPGFSGLRG